MRTEKAKKPKGPTSPSKHASTLAGQDGARTGDEADRTISDVRGHLKVFVVGPARSGTSTLFHAFRDIFRLPGDGESHLMPLVQKAVFEMRRYFERFANNPAQLTIKHFSLDHLEGTFFEYIRAFYRHHFRADTWIDKTPSSAATHGVKLILRIFPDARVIATTRNGLEVVRSRQKKFRETFEASCIEWTGAMEGIARSLDEKVPLLRIDQSLMARAPENAARQICSWIALEAHATRLTDYLRERRVEESGFSANCDALSSMDWSDADKATFSRICSPMMSRFGYRM